jgi:hypothetical protein
MSLERLLCFKKVFDYYGKKLGFIGSGIDSNDLVFTQIVAFEALSFMGTSTCPHS